MTAVLPRPIGSTSDPVSAGQRLAEALLATRIDLGLSQAEAADRMRASGAAIDRHRLSRIENARALPTVSQLGAAVIAYGIGRGWALVYYETLAEAHKDAVDARVQAIEDSSALAEE